MRKSDYTIALVLFSILINSIPGFCSAGSKAEEKTAIMNETAEEVADESSPATKSIYGQPLFTVETSDDTSAQSLNRISGSYETPYLSEDQIYQSSSHNRSGPFSREKAQNSQ